MRLLVHVCMSAIIVCGTVLIVSLTVYMVRDIVREMRRAP